MKIFIQRGTQWSLVKSLLPEHETNDEKSFCWY